jgi:uncharacterized protein YdaU (DUF1376 family)
MSFAFMPVYTGDYLRDTRHLSMSEHGCYFLLLTFCWDARGPLPLDERKVSGICNARSNDEIEAMRRVLNEFFVRMDDGWYNRRMQREVERADALSRVRSESGRKGYEAKAKHLPSTSQASAEHEPLPPPPPPQLPPETHRGRSRSPFVPPSLEEVRQFVSQNRLSVDPSTFIDYYTSNGWKVGKNPMKDWQATARRWDRTGDEKQASVPYV